MKQTSFNKVNGWGGKRSKAGRKNLSGTVNHMARPQVGLKTPLHLTLKLEKSLPTLRRKSLLRDLKKSMRQARELGLYVLHFSVQRDHIHLLAEAEDNESLRRGMTSLAGRFGKIVRLRAWLNSPENVKQSQLQLQHGRVFRGRYHLSVLRTPTQTKNALEYVLLNLSKHEKVIEYLDPFSSGVCFKEWKALLGKRFTGLIKFNVGFCRRENSRERTAIELQGDDRPLSAPRSWLAKTGWMRAA